MSRFHDGERAVQSRSGVAGAAGRLGRGITSGIPDAARPFLESQRLAVLAGVDRSGLVWASMVGGAPGLITVPSSRTLRVNAGLPDADPLSEGVAPGHPLGILVIDPERRRRLRVNGRVARASHDAIEVRTEEVFGNCPKYIQARAHEPGVEPGRLGLARRREALTEPQRRAIERADTLFIASVHADAGADASHRGGRPGFVRVMDERRLLIPDYAGNNMFQTLGNIAADPRVGLLFVDFDTGTTLQLTGRARILWESEALARLEGAQRALAVEVDAIVEIEGRGPLGWRFVESSPFNPR
jgi:predicted pyridoxine 5'-phosphate oxidase superfamily flavin-nucleotide-binding protein